MSSLTLEELLTPESEDQLTSDQLGLLQSAAFPVTQWGDTALPKLLIKADVRALAKLSDLVPTIAASGFVKFASGDWLTLLASSNYEEQRSLATFTQRVVRITDAGAAPRTFAPGDIVLSTSAGLVFRSVGVPGTIGASATLAVGSFVDVLIQGQSPGSAYNGAVGVWSFVTAIPGVTVADAPAGVTQVGTDDESDPSLQLALSTKWSTLGAGANDDAYVYNATHAPGAIGEVTRVLVLARTPLPGQVTLYIAGPNSSGTDGSNAVTTADTNSSITQTGSGPTVGVSGTPLGNYTATVSIVVGGSLGTATFKYTLDGGVTYSSPIATAATFVIPGTGLTLSFAAGTYVANTTYAWTSTLSVKTTVQNYLDPPSHLGKAPNCTDVFVSSAVLKVIAITGSMTAVSTELTSGQAKAIAALNALASTFTIGGNVELELIKSIIRSSFSQDTRNRLVMTAPVADTSLASNQVPVFDLSGFSWVSA